jgi:hypothetical protein
MSEDDIDRKALRRLLDKEEIREALLKYSRGVDRHDDDIADQAYHEGAVDDHGTFIGDSAQFIRHVGALHHSNWNVHNHYITNATIELDGDTAHVESYFFATLRRHDGVIDISGGRYADRFERRDGRWAIADRICIVEWTGEVPKPRLSLDRDLFVKGSQDRNDITYNRPLKQLRPHREIGLDRKEE